MLSSVASAEPPPSPLTATARLGVAWSDLPDDDAGSLDGERSFTAGLAFHVDVAHRVHPGLAIGVHAGFARVQGVGRERRAMFDVLHDYSYTAYELGVVAQVAVSDRIWLAPWIGLHQLDARYYLFEAWTDAQLGYGVALGADVYRNGRHRVALYTSAARSVKHDSIFESQAFLSFAVGAAYRY